MNMDKDNSYEIPFGAKDSELKGWEYTIPEGMEAEIKDGKIIVREKESEDERMIKSIIKSITDLSPACFEIYGVKKEDILAWLEKQGSQNLANSEKTCKVEQNPAWSEEDEKNIEKLDGFLTEVFCYGHVYVSQKDKEELQSWLKVLKERYTWKPSDEQIKALEEVRAIFHHHHHLWDEINPILYDYEELIRDLNKLKG